MTINQKIARLTRFMKLTAVSEAAGLSSSGLSQVVHGRSGLSRQSAVRVARLLGVDPGWLIDDSQEWPPVRIESGVAEPVAA